MREMSTSWILSSSRYEWTELMDFYHRENGFLRQTKLLGFLFVVFGLSSPLSAEEPAWPEIQSGANVQLSRSLEELDSVRARIAEEKIPLSSEVAKLERRVLELRRERDRLLRVREVQGADLSNLRRQVEAQVGQEDFINSRLKEFIRDFESRLDISELVQFEALTKAAKLAQNDAEMSSAEKRSAQIEVVRAGLSRLRDQLGGRIFEGEALGPDGVLTQGRFIALGPTVFFASDDSRVVGIVENQLNAADPVVVPIPTIDSGMIVELARDGSGALPFDATLGKALKKEKARKGLTQYVADGGAVGYVIIALGLTALLITAFKAWEIMGFESAEPEQVDAVLDSLAKDDVATANTKAVQISGVAGDMLTMGVANAHQSRSVLEEILFEKILSVRPNLERFLPFLAIIAATSPLLGLLGTVIGMIKTFQLITIFGTGDAKSLSSGISEALVTTALGLIVAIPVLVLHGALSRMAKHKLGLLEQLSVSFVNGIEAIKGNPRSDTES